jgi:hypothetical protein
MINLKELSERYKDVGLGYIRFGGKSYFEINSDIPLSLNSFGGTQGFVLNNKGEVELYDVSDKVLVKRHYYLTEDWNEQDEVDYETEHYWDKTTSNKWWGKTLDNYYPHRWYPDRKIVAFELVNDIPGFRKGKIFELLDFQIRPTLTVFYSVDDCLLLPEFFKPIYYGDM